MEEIWTLHIVQTLCCASGVLQQLVFLDLVTSWAAPLLFVAGTQATYSRPTGSPTIGGRVSTSPGGATYVKTTSGSIITVVPKSLATLGGKIISSNIVSGRFFYIYMTCTCLKGIPSFIRWSWLCTVIYVPSGFDWLIQLTSFCFLGTTTKITTIPMTSKPNVIVVQKTTGKGTTIQGLPGKNVVTTLLNAGVCLTFVMLVCLKYCFYFVSCGCFFSMLIVIPLNRVRKHYKQYLEQNQPSSLLPVPLPRW